MLDIRQGFRGIDKLEDLLTAINVHFDDFVVSLYASSEKSSLVD